MARIDLSTCSLGGPGFRVAIGVVTRVLEEHSGGSVMQRSFSGPDGVWTARGRHARATLLPVAAEVAFVGCVMSPKSSGGG